MRQVGDLGFNNNEATHLIIITLELQIISITFKKYFLMMNLNNVNHS